VRPLPLNLKGEEADAVTAACSRFEDQSLGYNCRLHRFTVDILGAAGGHGLHLALANIAVQN
jgi:hypothetical protein